MGELLSIEIPLMTFMLSPVWVPLLGVSLGILGDRVRPRPVTAAQAAVEASKEASAARQATLPASVVTISTRTSVRLAA